LQPHALQEFPERSSKIGAQISFHANVRRRPDVIPLRLSSSEKRRAMSADGVALPTGMSRTGLERFAALMPSR
jgi:hypothetical protein